MIAEINRSMLDAFFDYGPMVYAAIMIVLLTAVIVGMAVELWRDRGSGR